MSRNVVSDLIVDIGMSEGNDTDFYLKKGFRVVGVEADPGLHEHLAIRFRDEVRSDRLRILHRAAWAQSDEEVAFFVNAKAQQLSQIVASDFQSDQGTIVKVSTIDWSEIIAEWGVPYYCKVDIENAEATFLKSFVARGTLPTYFSVEAHNFKPIEFLYQAGYRRFKLLNQRLNQWFQQPNPPLEGVFVPNHKFIHCSGLFGRELPGSRWLDFRETAIAFDMIQKVKGLGTALLGWFDCHATLAE